MAGKNIPGARRRVYCLGFLSMVTSLVQVVLYIVILKIVVSAEHRDIQVATAAGLMAGVTSVYFALTGRILFLLCEKRYQDIAGPEWIWWFASMGVVLFNTLLLVWFCLLSDIMMATGSVLGIVLYVLFFFFAKDDIKFLREHDRHKEGEEVKEEQPL
ncbi:uncharacterized protein [Panulirus ornatus]|uniref:uncharacterized protein n=1 Tax=Panulirus ornatus TaxID=150431 RepID=UPI003A87A332